MINLSHVQKTEMDAWKKGTNEGSKVADPEGILWSRNFNSIDFSEDFEFYDAYFDRSDLSGCKMDNINFKNCNFRGANLANASVKGCDFSHANFYGANLEGVDFSECSMMGVVGARRYVKSLHIYENFSIAYSFDRFWIASQSLTYDQCANLKPSDFTDTDPALSIYAQIFYEKYCASEPKFLIELATKADPAINPNIPHPLSADFYRMFEIIPD